MNDHVMAAAFLEDHEEDVAPPPAKPAPPRARRPDESWTDYRVYLAANPWPGLKRNMRAPALASSIEVQLGLRDAEDGDMLGTGARSC